MIKRRLFTLLFIAVTAALTLQAGPREKKNILSVKNTITDDDIVFPESFDTDVHKMMTNWYLQNYTVLDAEVEDKNPGEVSEETFIRRLAAMPSVIEMPYNQVVRKHIERYVYRSRTLVEEMLGMSLYYMPIFEQALEKEGLPLELKYLPIVESAMDPNATSRVGAAGLWQFMVGTGKGLGLEINSLVDERRDPYRSSEMAAKYLKNLYQIYNDWSLAIAAYNCGPGNVNKALHRNGGVGDFWDIYDYLPRETRGYVPAFIAANYAMTYYKQHNISPSLASKPLITDTVTVRRRIHFAQIADVLNIPIEEIRTFNPQYRADVIPGDHHPYVLILPSQQIYSFILSEDSIDNYRDDLYAHRQVVEPGGQTVTAEDYISGRADVSSMRTITHKVGRGETASSIAAKYDMTTDELMALNNKSSERVKRGETLKVKAPGQDETDAETGIAATTTEVVETQIDETSSEELAQNEQALYDEVKNIEREAATKAPYKGSYTKQSAEPVVVSNDTKKVDKSNDQSRRRASKTNTSDWRERNNKYSHKDSASKKESKKKDNAEHSSKSKRSKKHNKPEQPKEVTVQKGESLTKIAEKTGVSVKDLERANGLENGNKIKAGEKIKIPTKAEAKQAATAEKKGGKSSKKESSKSSKKESKSSSKSSSGKSSKKSKKK
ncbi:MAG: transglycosylase SLT domain-containing protein [Muribaculaceae bacterium]|nr:transglycosylase SLT domain-containing protein [Muribaculaceae bacterium]